MTELTQAARDFRRRVEDEAAFLSTCDGGDPGAPECPSIWLLGIEPGWSLADEAADQQPPSADHAAQLAHYAVDLQLQWPFNRNAFKLLAAIEGTSPDAYRAFAERTRPFERGAKGYFKGNLFPEPFNNVGQWDAAATAATGFADKDDYRAWMRAVRLPVMKAWIERCRPRLVIGSGRTHLADFLAITGTAEVPREQRFEVNGHAKRIHVAAGGTVPVAVIPHLSGGSHSLNSNEAVAKAADLIRAELGQLELC